MSPYSVLRRLTAPAFAFLALSLTASPAHADYIINLTQASTPPVNYQGAIYAQSSQQPVGTGVFDPFVRIQMNGSERGYNTDARPVEFDTKDMNQWTHSLSLSSLAALNINGTQYFQFALDINEKGYNPGSLLSVNDFRVYLGDSPSLTGWNDGFGTHSVKVYDIDVGSLGDARVDLNAKLNPPGSGVADLNVYIPVANFTGFGSQYQYVYLYSGFGDPYHSDAGFEEWSALQGKNTTPPNCVVPAPPALLLGLIGIGGSLLGRRFRRKMAEPAKQ